MCRRLVTKTRRAFTANAVEGIERFIALCYSCRVKTIHYSREAAKALSRMPRNIVATIRAKVEQYAANPASLTNNVKALSGQPGYLRLRVGDWRVIFREDGTVIAVVRVAPRGSAYE